jgi:hypothetical protein
VSDLHNGIHGNLGPCGHVAGKLGLAEREPRRARGQIMSEELRLAGQGGGHREAAIANNLCCDTLPDLRFGQGIEGQGEVGMGMDVDEARGEDAPGRVNLPRRAFAPPLLDG